MGGERSKLMQGGVTSGVVYPGLVCKLAEYYDFQNIGGTSAGAIAASFTAAADMHAAMEEQTRSTTWQRSPSGSVLILKAAAGRIYSPCSSRNQEWRVSIDSLWRR